MTVARWEYWSVAAMLTGTHGEEAEAHVERRVQDALDAGDRAAVATWREIGKALPLVRRDQAGNRG